MAYDAQKAHEYYEKYRKKGLLKGRKKKSKFKPTYKKPKSSKKGSSKKKSTKVTTDGLNEVGLEAAYKAQAQIEVEKKAFTKKLNEEMKKRIEETKAQMAGMSDTEKEVAAEAIRLKYKDIKSQATAVFKQKYATAINQLKANKDFRK